MNILGISISHDSASCLFKDGKLIYYIEEERLNRKKHHMINFDKLDYHGVSKLKEHNITEIDCLAIASFRRTHDFKDHIIIDSIIKHIIDVGIRIKQVFYEPENHHIYHAYNALYASKFTEAAILICDGSGAWTDEFTQFREIESIYYFNQDSFKTIYKHYSNLEYIRDDVVVYDNFNKDYEIMLSNAASVGSIFENYCAAFDMFWMWDSGKLMGMSSYGKLTNNNDWFDLVNKNVIFNEQVSKDLKLTTNYDNFQLKANVAKKVQEETKKYAIYLIKKAIKLTNSKNVVLSGGYFLNCVNNYEYLKEFPSINFYVDPISYDGGTAIGVCAFVNKLLDKDKNIDIPNHLYLG
jgi:carbamoyltransferase